MSISVSDCRQVVGMFYGIEKITMEGRTRKRSIARPRQMAMTLAREMTNASYPRIGAHFGGRDHTTALFAERRIHDLESWHEPTKTVMDGFRRTLLELRAQREAARQ